MELCQIVPFGGQDLWVNLALREFPKTKWLIVLANKPQQSPTVKYEEVLNERKEQQDYWEMAVPLIEQLQKNEEFMPPERKRKISLIEPVSINDFYELLRYFRGLFDFIIKKGFKIAVHLNSGPMIWRVALYLSAAEFRSEIEFLYLFDKKSGERQDLWIYRDLLDQEKIILEILADNQRASVTDIQERYQSKTGKGTLSYVLKLVNNLVEDGLLLESKEGRTKFIELSPLGKALSSFEDYKSKFEKELG
ncbi:MAG: winged helix-turn-helix domain-containing protein [Candidatus Helarchaeota archaeon]